MLQANQSLTNPPQKSFVETHLQNNCLTPEPETVISEVTPVNLDISTQPMSNGSTLDKVSRHH